MGTGYSRLPRTEPRRTLVLIDGENLVFRFQDMIRQGAIPNNSVKHIEDLLVWHQHFANFADIPGLVRVNYYMSMVGTHEAVDDAKDKVGEIFYRGTPYHDVRICPHIFKKEKSSQKLKIVDISLTIDALRHTYENHIDDLYLYSGDADYVPLVEEVMRQGKRVTVAALSSGLSPKLKRAADAFFDLDKWLLKVP